MDDHTGTFGSCLSIREGRFEAERPKRGSPPAQSFSDAPARAPRIGEEEAIATQAQRGPLSVSPAAGYPAHPIVFPGGRGGLALKSCLCSNFVMEEEEEEKWREGPTEIRGISPPTRSLLS